MLATEEPVAMTDWELLDFAVQVVRNDLKGRGYKIMSTHSNPQVDPNIWFVADIARGPEWVVVRAARFPGQKARTSPNLNAITRNVAHISGSGHFASVTFAGVNDPQGPLWRGHGLEVGFVGLEPITQAQLQYMEGRQGNENSARDRCGVDSEKRFWRCGGDRRGKRMAA